MAFLSRSVASRRSGRYKILTSVSKNSRLAEDGPMRSRHRPIPTELSDLTPDWLGAALGTRVDAVTLLDSHSGTTGRARLALRGAGAPASVFVKLAPFDAAQRRFVAATQMGVREARLYRDLAAELPVRVPRVWYADFDAEERYVMV